MRTTSGKTKSRRPARLIEIWQGERLVNVRRASSLRQALLEFAKERYPNDDRFGIGNTLLIGDTTYTAKEKPWSSSSH